MKIDMSKMLAAADDAGGLLKALANRHRLIIICQLTEHERSVGELAALLNIRDFNGVAASFAVAKGRLGDNASGRTDDLVFDQQPASAGTRAHPLPNLLPADRSDL